MAAKLILSICTYKCVQNNMTVIHKSLQNIIKSVKHKKKPRSLSYMLGFRQMFSRTQNGNVDADVYSDYNAGDIT